MPRHTRRPAQDPALMAVLGLDQPTPDPVDAGPARKHALALLADGWGTRSIAKATGLHRRIVQALINGRTAADPPSRRVRPCVEERILALPLSGDLRDETCRTKETKTDG